MALWLAGVGAEVPSFARLVVAAAEDFNGWGFRKYAPSLRAVVPPCAQPTQSRSPPPYVHARLGSSYTASQDAR